MGESGIHHRRIINRTILSIMTLDRLLDVGDEFYLNGQWYELLPEGIVEKVDVFYPFATLVYNMVQEGVIKRWPEYEGESVDTENFSSYDVEVTFEAGGDWQPCHRITIDMDKLEVTEVEELETPK